MADVLGVNHKSLLNLNRIGERGVEGGLQVKSEVFDLAVDALAVGDVLKSDYLQVPGDSVIMNIRVVKNVTTAFTMRFREEGASTTTTLGDTAAAAGDTHLAANSTNAAKLLFKRFTKPIELEFVAKTVLTKSAGQFVRIQVDYLNL